VREWGAREIAPIVAQERPKWTGPLRPITITEGVTVTGFTRVGRRVTGVVTEIRLENPHSWFYVEVTDGAGKVAKWGFEGNTPTSLIRAGYKRDAVKVGDKVTIKGSHARDASANMGAAREIVLADGRTFIVGPKGAADAD